MAGQMALRTVGSLYILTNADICPAITPSYAKTLLDKQDEDIEVIQPSSQCAEFRSLTKGNCTCQVLTNTTHLNTSLTNSC
jgi:hypothetical protein